MVGYSKAHSESFHPQTVDRRPSNISTMNLDQVSLDGNHERADGELYLTGTQALVKVTMLQGICDRQAEMLDSWHNPMSGVAVV